jgi:CRISPR-associated exonuclease Cas4
MVFLSTRFKKNAKKLKKKYNIQAGKITYSDLNTPAKSLFSKRYRISGKPDYIVKKQGYYYPVEIKTGIHFKPKTNHIFQLAAYCQILEDNYSCFVPHGFLIYTDSSKSFEIPFDPKIRFELESAINNMRKSLKNCKIKRNHNDLKKCMVCSMRKYCDQKIY